MGFLTVCESFNILKLSHIIVVIVGYLFIRWNEFLLSIKYTYINFG